MNKSEFITVVAQKSGQPRLSPQISSTLRWRQLRRLFRRRRASLSSALVRWRSRSAGPEGLQSRTQEEVEIPASYRPFFKPGSKLKEAANVKKPGKGKKKKVIPADGYWKTSARLPCLFDPFE